MAVVGRRPDCSTSLPTHGGAKGPAVIRLRDAILDPLEEIWSHFRERNCRETLDWMEVNETEHCVGGVNKRFSLVLIQNPW